MEKRLSIQVDNIKLVKSSDGKDVPVVFSLSLPYGVPYALVHEAVAEIAAEIKAMDELAAQKAAKPMEEIKPEIVEN